MSATADLDALPIVDFSALGTSEAADRALARELDGIFRSIGFCYFRNIGVAQSLVDGLFRESARFHALPEATKRALAMNATHRGYMAPNSSVNAEMSMQPSAPNDIDSPPNTTTHSCRTHNSSHRFALRG